MGMIPGDIAVDVERKQSDGGGRQDLRQIHGEASENGEMEENWRKGGRNLWRM